ncbi:hypothetical protein BDV96DRAFT_591564 [Lophiotrema nucula]|uniref:Uncharacterized protein n=1 Tax=Lophiotrema nucula TaxID=690887 RepID=A0A6A5YI93_9PLEO|nr:hypothetical protein BDV96DRAFT_591564 [Lophiotrema nucula]
MDDDNRQLRNSAIDHGLPVRTINNAWKMIQCEDSHGAKLVGTCCTFAVKRNENSRVMKKKTRVVAQCFSQAQVSTLPTHAPQ